MSYLSRYPAYPTAYFLRLVYIHKQEGYVIDVIAYYSYLSPQTMTHWGHIGSLIQLDLICFWSSGTVPWFFDFCIHLYSIQVKVNFKTFNVSVKFRYYVWSLTMHMVPSSFAWISLTLERTVSFCETKQWYMWFRIVRCIPDSKFHGDNMGPTWVLSAPEGPHVGPMNLAIRDILVKFPLIVVRYIAGHPGTRQHTSGSLSWWQLIHSLSV